jgi:hypothetical protein
MSDSRIDAERIAALLDGGLSGEERAALLERLAQSSETMELLGDAAAIVHELDPRAAANPAEVVDPRIRRRQMPWLLAVAAAVVAAVSIPFWMRSRPIAVGGNDALALLSVPIDRPATGVDEPWRASRGNPETVTPKGRAVRVGARTIDLEASLRTRDRVTDSALLNDISAELASVPASAPLVTSLWAITEDTSTSDRAIRIVEVRNALASFLGREWVATGAFIEAARIAATLQDTAFFASSRSRSMMERVTRSVELDSAARQAAGRALALGWDRTVVDWAALQRELTMLLRILVADALDDSVRVFTFQRTGTPPKPLGIEVPR